MAASLAASLAKREGECVKCKNSEKTVAHTVYTNVSHPQHQLVRLSTSVNLCTKIFSPDFPLEIYATMIDRLLYSIPHLRETASRVPL